METSPSNKMIKTSDEETKRVKKKKRRYFLPNEQRSVEATSVEEAGQIINKKKDNK